VDTANSNGSSSDARARIQLRLRAAELIAHAMESSDTAERDALLAQARVLIATADCDDLPSSGDTPDETEG
jgi:hypothetical protein